MPLFLDTREKENFTIYRRCHPVGQDFFWALCNRVDQRAASPGHHGDGREAQWWFSAAEFLTDAAMTHALKPSPTVAAWLRTEVLSLIRRPVSDWVGPPFRNHSDDTEPVGHLETAHLTWGTAVVLDLAGDIFSDSERTEIETILRERGIPMCRRWLDRNHHLSHWRCVLGAGVAVAAAVLDDRAERERAVADYRLSLQIFQSDGSHGESLQYANSAAYTLMLAREALLRRDPALASRLPAEPWNRMPRWQTASLFYQKPLAGWARSQGPAAPTSTTVRPCFGLPAISSCIWRVAKKRFAPAKRDWPAGFSIRFMPGTPPWARMIAPRLDFSTTGDF